MARNLQSSRLGPEFTAALMAYGAVYLGFAWLSLNPALRSREVAVSEVPQVLVNSIFLNWFLFVVAAAVIMLLFRLGFAQLTFTRHALGSSVFALIAGLVAMCIINVLAGNLAAQVLPQEPADPSLQAVFQYFQPASRALMLAPPVMFLTAGFPEELFRAYVLSFAAEGRAPYLSGFALITTSLFFAAGHIYQGAVAAVVLFPIGLFLGWFYLSRKNLWELVFLHTLYDSLIFILAATLDVSQGTTALI